jgi:hypothetical protein
MSAMLGAIIADFFLNPPADASPVEAALLV